MSSGNRVGELIVKNVIQLFINNKFTSTVQKTEDGRYIIVQPDGRSIPLKVTSVPKETPEPKKYIVKSKLAFSNSIPVGS